MLYAILFWVYIIGALGMFICLNIQVLMSKAELKENLNWLELTEKMKETKIKNEWLFLEIALVCISLIPIVPYLYLISTIIKFVHKKINKSKDDIVEE